MMILRKNIDFSNVYLFQSESPAQVGLFMVTFLLLYVAKYGIGPNEWGLIWLFYDNMCTWVIIKYEIYVPKDQSIQYLITHMHIL